VNRAGSVALLLAVACGGPTPSPEAPPAVAPEPPDTPQSAACVDWSQARTVARADEALALRRDGELQDLLARACESPSGPHPVAAASRALLAATTPEAERLREFVRTRGDSALALALALARTAAMPAQQRHETTLALCEALRARPALAVTCFEAVPALTDAEAGAALKAYGELAVLTAADLERVLRLGDGEATRPLRECMTAPHRSHARPADRETLGALAFKLATVATPDAASRCLRRLAFDHCRDAALGGGACPAPQSVAPVIREAAADGVTAFVALHGGPDASTPVIDLPGWRDCQHPENIAAGARAPMMLMMHVALVEALRRPELTRGLPAAPKATPGLFSAKHHLKCARALWCHEHCEIAGFTDYFAADVPAAPCPRTCDPSRPRVPPVDEPAPDDDEYVYDANGVLVKASLDPDRDGFVGELDQCPDAPETNNKINDGDGCPDSEMDRDGDQVPHDACPEERETFNKINDADGCPDGPQDRDGDEIPDAKDLCPDARETRNQIQDADGCPDSAMDRDGDRVPDRADRCVDQRETFNHIADDDGCPDSADDPDGDGVMIKADLCPTERETRNRIQDLDGCPDAPGDQDGDRIPDRDDKCPTRRGPLKTAGCPPR